MSEAVQYVTNQQGERVGVLLDLETYDRLVSTAAPDEELLTFTRVKSGRITGISQ